MNRYLVLEDGTVFSGTAFGADIETTGEVVFNTGMSGYQETITDSSYCDQIITFTYPLIGNYGISADAVESVAPSCSGVVVHELARRASNWRNEMSLDDYLREQNIPGISGVDTRRLTRIIREHGVLRGALLNELPADHPERSAQYTARHDQIARVSTQNYYPSPSSGLRVVLIDFGLKYSILRELAKRNCNVTVVPHDTPASKIEELHPDGIILSNGPGNPEDEAGALPIIRELQSQYPLMGICMGHQLFALANGARAGKMRFGHRGFNHPVREVATGKTFFTAQNHGYAVQADSLAATPLIATYTEINDGTIEGLRHRSLPTFSVQFHPDATPGPHDAAFLFDEFIALMNDRQHNKQSK